MATVVTIAQQKGGAGKTSLAAHLATCLSAEGGLAGRDMRHGGHIRLIDLDPQRSLSDWFQLRQQRVGEDDRLSLRSVTGIRFVSEMIRARAESDLVLIDCPPHAEEPARMSMRAADLVIVPIQPSPLDVWAARSTLELATRERRPVLFVFNRVQNRTKTAQAIAEALKRETLPIANAALGNRVGYIASLMRGQGITEADPRSTAADEIRSLAAEVLKRLQ